MLSRTVSYAALLSTSVAVLALCAVDAVARPRHGQWSENCRHTMSGLDYDRSGLRPNSDSIDPVMLRKSPATATNRPSAATMMRDRRSTRQIGRRQEAICSNRLRWRPFDQSPCVCPSGERVRTIGPQSFACETIVVNKPPKSDGDRAVSLDNRTRPGQPSSQAVDARRLLHRRLRCAHCH